MTKNSFILRTNYRDIVADMSDTQAGKLIKAIFDYVATGEFPAGLSDIAVGMAFKFIQQDIDYANKQYEQVLNARKQAGIKSGKIRKLNKTNKCSTSTETNKRTNVHFVEHNDVVVDVVNDVVVEKNKETTTTDCAAQKTAPADGLDFSELPTPINPKTAKPYPERIRAEDVCADDGISPPAEKEEAAPKSKPLADHAVKAPTEAKSADPQKPKQPKPLNWLQSLAKEVCEKFEPDVKTDDQKRIWFKRNCRQLKEIYEFCNRDPAAAMGTISACAARLAKAGINEFGYEAVLRNISTYYADWEKEQITQGKCRQAKAGQIFKGIVGGDYGKTI